MKANKFIKKFGWDEAKKILSARRTWIDKKSDKELTDNSFVIQTRTYEYAIGTLYKGNFTEYDKNSYRCGEVNLLMLENLVKSYNFVESFGGLENAKDEYFSCVQNHEPASHIVRAIEDVESCMLGV